MTPFFSIIIPTYQSQRLISHAIESILQQTFSDFEIIIVDGLSVDGTLLEIKKFKDDRIKVFSEADKGIYDAMNKGVKWSEAKWLYFMGSDDRLYQNNVLQKTYSFLTENPAIEMVYGNVKIIGDNQWAKNGDQYDGEFSVEKLFQRNICHQSAFYGRSVFNKLGFFNIQYTVCADWDFNHRCFANVNVAYIDEIVAFFSAGGKSTAYSSDKFTSEHFVSNLSRYYAFGYFNPLFRKSAYWFLENAKVLLKEKRIIRSLFYLFIGLFHSNSNQKLGMIKIYFNTLRS